VTQRDHLLRDAHEARREAESANRAKDDFLAMVSHELRAPLATIRIWTDLLRRGALDAAGSAKALAVIDRSNRQQMRLISDLLDVSRIVSGKLGLELGRVDLGTIMHAAVEASRPGAAEKGVVLEEFLARDTAHVWGDPARLEQVIGNLLSNAIKFTPAGGRVTMRLAQAGDHAILTVEDTGEGIAPDLLPHVFERFRQGDGGSARRHGGLGLGLAIVRHLVDRQGGMVEARSAGRGRGSTFVVKLPLMRALEPATSAVPAVATCW
jgi:signal transduction histidine kinase